MVKKVIIPACFAVVAVISAGLINSFMDGGNNVVPETVEETVAEESTSVEETEAEASTEEYVETDKYRESRSNQKILPERVEISDADGNVTMIEVYDPDARSLVVGSYGEIGQFPSEVYLVGNDKEVLLNRMTYNYNDDGMVVEEYCYEDPNPYDEEEEEDLVSVTEYTYYSGNLAKEDYYVYDASGVKNLASTTEWTYDENGFPIRKDIYYDSVLSYYEEIKCNTNGKPVEMRQYTYNGVITGVREYEYTETGEYLTYREYTGDKATLSVETNYVYDSRDYLRRVDVKYYDYIYDEENENGEPVISEEHYEYIYPADVQNRLGNLE